jgi:hypothetical protein
LKASDHGLNQRGGLAGPRAGKNQERPSAMITNPLLILVQLRCLNGQGATAIQPQHWSIRLVSHE